MKEYFEAHITMEGNFDKLGGLVNDVNWKFSAIDGDINLGAGVKCYATRQFNLKIGKDKAIKNLISVANSLEKAGAKILRRKIEIVIFDDRSKAVKNLCDGSCIECVGR